MQTIADLAKWIEPHVAHFVYALGVTFAALQIVLGGQTYSVATEHGAVAFVVAFAVAVWRAFEASGPTTPPAA